MLHGEIKINDSIIGEWWAVRKTSVIHEYNPYECGVRIKGHERKFEIWHRYDDGAAALAAQILAEAIEV